MIQLHTGLILQLDVTTGCQGIIRDTVAWCSVAMELTSQYGAGNPEARAVIELIANAASPEEAAKTGRRFQRQQPALVRSDWDGAKLEVMLAALRAKVCLPALAYSD